MTIDFGFSIAIASITKETSKYLQTRNSLRS